MIITIHILLLCAHTHYAFAHFYVRNDNIFVCVNYANLRMHYIGLSTLDLVL